MSGNVGKRDERFLIMAGVAVFETAVYHVIEEIDGIMRRYLPGRDIGAYELHANAMFAGRKEWRRVPRQSREELAEAVLHVLRGPSANNLRIFGMAIEKHAVSPEDPVEHAYEQLCDRFDQFLRRRYVQWRDRQRGLLIVDKSRYEETLQALAHEYRQRGTRWGSLRNLAEVPLFVDSRASRLLQLADLVSYALWRRYERNDPGLMRPILRCFDQAGGILHGLYHKKQPGVSCDCPACVSRM